MATLCVRIRQQNERNAMKIFLMQLNENYSRDWENPFIIILLENQYGNVNISILKFLK